MCAKRNRFGSVCVFFQYGASGNSSVALAKVNELIKHGCGRCGSAPTNTEWVEDGELTVNFVEHPCCKKQPACSCLMEHGEQWYKDHPPSMVVPLIEGAEAEEEEYEESFVEESVVSEQ